MKVALGQINPVLGAFEANAEKILEYTKQAQSQGCELVVFPECALFGYHPFDLLEREHIVEHQMKVLEELRAQMPQGIYALVGVISINSSMRGRAFYNSAALLHGSDPVRLFHKQLLPTGDVFDEARFIEPGQVGDNFIEIGGKKVLITICEDIWAWSNPKGRSLYQTNPLLPLSAEAPELVLNLSASPFHLGKMALRERVVSLSARHFGVPFVYVNMVGAQDEIIYDGASFVMDGAGRPLLRAQRFAEELLIFECGKSYDCLEPTPPEAEDQTALLKGALVMGIRDFVEKSNLDSVVIGISGGIDSAVVAALATQALGPDRVLGLALPGPFSSDLSFTLAEELAKNLGIQFRSISINEGYVTVMESLKQVWGESPEGLVQENLQARLRGLILMAETNRAGALLLSTSNKIEYSVGYSTLYGDMCGGLAPIGDLTKAQVYQVAKLINVDGEVIPEKIISREPSAELRPNQKDTDSLPPYPELDGAVVSVVELGRAAETPLQQWTATALAKSEFKRWQAPPILKVSFRAFGRGRRYPVAHRAPL